jgi:hypothetical protein
MVVRVKDACVATFRPPSSASATEIRKNGGIATALGFVLVVLLGGAPLALETLHVRSQTAGRAILALVLLAYGLFVVGGYRLVTGRGSADERGGTLGSLGRILFGVLYVFASGAVAAGGLILAGYALGMN